MSISNQAKSGLRTFVLTFVTSFLVFGAIYYIVSDLQTEDVSIESSLADKEVLGYTKTTEDFVVEDAGVIEPSPFGTLIEEEVVVPQREVLAGATVAETQETTVPETGVASVTIGLIVSVALFAFFAYIVFINPRNYALSNFERKFLDE